ncbi:MAG: tRNA pseudouridine(55) synthase TruB [Candidatus Gastranaerophilales bacterium]|nr:tRNA pseudouridine(55) synthase TruB [Candidatus Gastranaerophilales bacterium]
MSFGVINIDKPQGFTSHDVVAKLRKILNTKKIGHTGTLDPLATGVLPICVGKCTKFIQYFDDTKAYRASIKLGITTDSFDIDGKILSENSVILDREEVLKALKNFEGEIVQTPPMHSAVHYQGKRLYEYARKNIEIKDIPKRKVFIKSVNLVDIEEKDSSNPILIVEIDCSSGTYIRSIVNDLGKKLNYGATLVGLIRTRAGKFLIKDSWTIEKVAEVAENNRLEEIFINPSEYVQLKPLNIDEKILEYLKYGKFFETKDENFKEDEMLKLIYDSQIVAIAQYKQNTVYPKNVFYEGE